MRTTMMFASTFLLFALAAAQRPPPRPDVSPCERELAAHCSEEHNNMAACDACVKKVPLGPKTDGNCTARQEMAFCEGRHPRPTPVPVADKCHMEMRQHCGAMLHNETECDHCLKLNDRKLSEANCTRREELAFCEARPTPSLQCERFLMRDCEQARKSGEDACDACVKKVGTSEDCTLREELVFCNATRPPTPGPVGRDCERDLHVGCKVARQASQEACDRCVRKVGRKDSCTPREELSFCNATKPEPIRSPCDAELARGCGVARKEGVRACDVCAKKTGASGDAKCTPAEEMAWCGGPAPKPGPVGDKCEKRLAAACPKLPKNVCDICAGTTGANAGCTAREELSYCDGSAPRPAPTPAECTSHLKGMCKKPGSSTAQCMACAKKVGDEHNCPKSSESAACIAGKAPSCAAAEQKLCQAAKAQGTKACKDCLQTNSAELMKVGCHASDETEFCGGKAPTCAAAEQSLCAAAKAQGKAQCAACLQKNSAALMKIGCHASDETKFCEA